MCRSSRRFFEKKRRKKRSRRWAMGAGKPAPVAQLTKVFFLQKKPGFLRFTPA
jgi:hypothetical protein